MKKLAYILFLLLLSQGSMVFAVQDIDFDVLEAELDDDDWWLRTELEHSRL